MQRCMAVSAGEPMEGNASPPVKPPGALGVTPRVEGSPGKGMVIDLPSTLADSDSDGEENEEVGALRPLDRQVKIHLLHSICASLLPPKPPCRAI